MPYVTIGWHGVDPTVRPCTDDEAEEIERAGGRVSLVEDAVLEAWARHRAERTAWNTLWRVLDERAVAEQTRLEDETIRLRYRSGDASLEDAQVALRLRSPRGGDTIERARWRCLGPTATPAEGKS